MTKASQVQQKATEAWNVKNKEHRTYRASLFRKKATFEDLEELTTINE